MRIASFVVFVLINPFLRAEDADPVAYLTRESQRVLKGCQVKADDGTVLYTPDGHGNYRALWTRDFAYMVENAGDLMPQADIEAALRFLIRGQRADGAIPDRVDPKGHPVYTGGGEDHPLGEPNLDNPPFLVIAVDEYLKLLPEEKARGRFLEWRDGLGRGLDWVPRAESGLVYNDPAKPHSPYGFTDTIAKTGELCFESILYWTACKRLAKWETKCGRVEKANDLERRAELIEANLTKLFDGERGALLAATKDCRQIDIWANAYAISERFPLGPKRDRILKFLVSNRERFLWHGQVRHLLQGEHWQRLLADVPFETYQNGAYWATASGWMIDAFTHVDLGLATQTLDDVVADFKAGGVCECVGPNGYRKLESYVASATNVLAAARRLARPVP